jgi:ferredoxin-nitrite reductase
MTPEQTRGLAEIARRFGDGSLRLTVWQNVLITGILDVHIGQAVAAIDSLGLSTSVSPIRAGLVACTGNFGCRFAAADTKSHAAQIADYCEAATPMEGPINIHLTGCHHSCAQHYIGDIGLIGARVPVNEEGDTVEGYHILAGGGFAEDAGIAAELYQNVRAEDAPRAVAKILSAYRNNRSNVDETFVAFARRHDAETLRRLADEETLA